MICNFCGELLFHPAALELSGYTCSNNCSYCFANIRKSVRDPEWNRVMKFFREARKRQTLEAVLFNEGFPVCISNLSDPFVANNKKMTAQIVKLFENFPNGIFFQTKCTDGIDETLDALGSRRNVVFYITITCGRDEVSKQVESGAAPTSQRIQTAIMLKKMGFEVEIGLNPLVFHWMEAEELHETAQTLIQNGVKDFFIQPLYLKSKEISEFTPARRQSFYGFENEDLAAYCKECKDIDYCYAVMCHINQDLGGNAYTAYSVEENNTTPDMYRRALGKVFPMNMDFYNYVNQHPEMETFSFEQWFHVITGANREFFERDLGVRLDNYILRTARQLWNGHPANQGIRNFKQTLKVYWNNKAIGFSPQNSWGLEAAGKDENGNILVHRKDLDDE